jgi:hypothetical protein
VVGAAIVDDVSRKWIAARTSTEMIVVMAISSRNFEGHLHARARTAAV